MKRLMALLVSVMLLAGCAAAFAEDAVWTCPGCGAVCEAEDLFCSKCGTARPEDGNWTCPGCGAVHAAEDLFCAQCGAARPEGTADSGGTAEKVRLDLEIAFEKNAYFSTYDVRLFVDGEWVTTMRHGTDYACSVEVTPGRHIILFREDGASPAEGSTVVNVERASVYRCTIHAKYSAVQITDEKTEAIAEDRPAPEKKSDVPVDGDLRLEVHVEFRKNAVFSAYDVDMYLDDILVATLAHGKDYDNTLLVSAGPHMLTFCKSGDSSVRGSCTFRAEKDARFSCRIEAKRKRVEVLNDKLTD